MKFNPGGIRKVMQMDKIDIAIFTILIDVALGLALTALINTYYQQKIIKKLEEELKLKFNEATDSYEKE